MSTKINPQLQKYIFVLKLLQVEKNILLQTIKLPKNLKHLKQKLPKSKWDSDVNLSFDAPKNIKKE